MAKALLDPVVGLSLSLQANRGIYALLLGSGVSRTARIPTGWEVTLDLIRKLATAQGKDCANDPASWYRKTFGGEPDYSDLLKSLGETPEERSQLLKAYFEPTDEEREQGWKKPTQAHHAVARLVAAGYFRIILTTNFDRLLERAIEEAGVTPTVISTPEAIAGSLPLIHQRCCVIKLHGDYLDTRIKNTVQELSKYDRGMDRLLDKVFDEFGLIVCGWSGVWDTALRGAIDRCKSRRFSTFWTSVSSPAKEAIDLIQRRGGQIIHIAGADLFFQQLQDKTEALEASLAPHPVTTTAAVATLKKFIAEDRYSVRLHDLIFDEAENVHSAISAINKGILGHGIKNSEIPNIYNNYRQAATTLIELFVHGCFWSRPETDSLFSTAIQQVCRQPTIQSGSVLHEGFAHYVGLVLLYAGGVTSIGAGKFKLFESLLIQTKLRDQRRTAPLALALSWSSLTDFSKTIFPTERKWTPLSEHMFIAIREPLRQYFPDDAEYDDMFDRFEYMLALLVADQRSKPSSPLAFWGPVGRFGWKAVRRAYEGSIVAVIDSEIKSLGADWPPLQAGLFGGSLDRLESVRTTVSDALAKLQWY